MILLQTDFRIVIDEAPRFIQPALFCVFIFACYRLWAKTENESTAHRFVGQVALIVLTAGLFLLWYQPERVFLFRMLTYPAISIWLFFLTGRGSRATPKISAEHSVRLPILAREFLAFQRYLSRRPTHESFWTSAGFKQTVLWGGFTLWGLFGFSRAINGFQWGYMLAAKMARQSEVKTEQVVNSAVKSATAAAEAAVRKETIPLYNRQSLIMHKSDSSAKVSAFRYQELSAKTDRAARKADKAASAAERTRNSSSIIISPLQPKPASGIIPSSKVPQVEPARYDRRGRRISDATDGIDSTLYATWYEREGY